MATKRQASHPSSNVRREDILRCRHDMRYLLGQIAQSLPEQKPGFQSALLLHFQRASDAARPASPAWRRLR